MGRKRGRERDKGAAPDVEMEEEPQDLSSALDAINRHPARYDLYARALSMTDDFEEKDMIRQLWFQQFPLTEEQWRAWITDRQARAEETPTEDSYKAVLELFELAMADVKSLPLMQLLVDYILSQYYSARGLARPDADQIQAGEAATRDMDETEDPAQLAIWSDDIVTSLLQSTALQSSYDWAHSGTIWQHLFTYLRDLYLRQPSEALKEQLNTLFLMRLAEPHVQHEETMQAYSSFTSATDQANYESHLIEAQEIYAPAKELIGRHEAQERKLATQQGELPYINYATSLSKQNEPSAAAALMERGLAVYSSSLDLWTAYLRLKYSALRKKMEDGDFEATAESANEMLVLANRATRFVPSSSATWIALMTANERLGELNAVESNFARALATGHFDQNIDELTKLYTARADIHRQAWQEIVAGESSLEESEGFVEVDAILKEGLERVRKVQKGGDPQMRLERYLVRFYERNDNLAEAIRVLASATQVNKSSYAIWSARADLFVRHNQLDEARNVYLDAMKMILDYPEYLFDAYVTFEHHNGTLHEIQEAENAVAGKTRAIQKHRQQQAMQFQQSTMENAHATTDSASQVDVAPNESNMQVDMPPVASTSKLPIDSGESLKRSAEASAPESSASKKTKTAHDQPTAKRDRERTTVIVSKLPSEAVEDDLRRLFNDCGEIFEIKIFTSQLAATVEFAERESVPMAKTKDKKIVKGQEVDVNAAWASTLWLTNFAEGTDDSAMRQLLAPHGEVLEIRWPDRNFKTTRRFAYVTMVTEAAARSAIESLHGKTVEGSTFAMQVHISDPDRKGSRSDAKANLREVRVTNLKPSVTSELLTKVFAECGVVKDVRVDGKGAAFVEFEDEESVSKAVNALNDRELQGKHIAVTRVDHRGGPGHRAQTKGKAGKAKSDFQARIIRLTNLPPHAQSDLIRQEFEKLLLNVIEIGLDADGQAASVEFANVADAGRALLLPAGSLIVAETPIIISEGFAGKAPSTAAGFTPRAARGTGALPARGGRGRGGRGGFAGRARPGIGAARPNGAAAPKGQDAFRAMLSGGTSAPQDGMTGMQE